MLIGNYRADRHLGDGATGKLYEGVDSRSRQRVMIRVVGSTTDARAVSRIQNWARSLVQLNLPGVVGVLDCGLLQDGSLYIVCPLAPGQSLAEQFVRLAGQPFSQAMQLGHHLAEMLATAHRHGIFHLALRPSQILVPTSAAATTSAGLSLLGLGLASALGRTTVTPEGLSPPPFAAPEQYQNSADVRHAVDDKADVFALGVLLWQAFTGMNPFPVHGGPQRGGAPTFAMRGERPPASVIDLLSRMVAASPSDRPSMRVVASLFESLIPKHLGTALDDDTSLFLREKTIDEVSALAHTMAAPLPPPAAPPEPLRAQPVHAEQEHTVEETAFLPTASKQAGGPPADPHAGLMFGNFETVRKIGEGGMGIVYEAKHRKIGRRAAIKIMHKELAQNEEYATRFLNEARAVNIIQHRGLVEISEYGKLKDGTLFIVMEYLQGQSLRERINTQKRFDEQQVVHLAVQIARALAATHGQGIIHRDLKPENIMLVPDPVTPEQDWVKILDFGIAKMDPRSRQVIASTVHRRTEIGAVMGTPNYMAPEQFGRAEEADGRADVFSLSVVLYELLAGEPPYTGTPVQLVNKTIRPLSICSPSVSPRMVSLVERMMSVEAAERPSMDQVAKELALMRRGRAQFRIPLMRPQLLLGAGTLVLLMGALLMLLLNRSRPLSLAEAKAHALTVVAASLRSSQPALPIRAIKALAKSGDLNQRGLLESVLRSSNPEEVEEAVRALGQLGSVASHRELLGLLKRPHTASMRVTIGDALARLKDPEGLKMLSDALEQDDPEIKLRAAALLLEHGNQAGAPALWERITRADLSEQASLITIAQLAQAGDTRARKLLEDALSRTEKLQARLFAAWSLGKLGDVRGRAVLIDVAAQPGPFRLLANQLLAAIGEPVGGELLIEVARSVKEPEENRELAIAGLADCGREDAIAVLDGLLNKSSTSELLRIAAAGAVLRLVAGDRMQLAQQSLSWAKAALESDSTITRELAAASLGEISSDEAIPPLTQALRDRQREVRRTAARSLGTKSARAALSALASSLDDQDVEVRAASMRAISRVLNSLRKRGDKEADGIVLSRLKTLANTGSERDRVVASGMLLQLGDTEQHGQLRAALSSHDSLTRRLAVDMSDADQSLLERALKDSDHSVRFAAARRLADQGSRLGISVLREAVQSGDLDGLTAYGKLKKLGEQAEPPEGLAQILQSADVTARLDVLEAVPELPSEQALALLYIASHDFAPAVRRRAVEVAGGFYKRTGSLAFMSMIRMLLHDPNALVRSGVAELLLVLPGPTKLATPIASSSKKPQILVPASAPPVPSSEGLLRFIGDESVRIQIDRSTPQSISSKPISIGVGKHRISYVGGVQEITISGGETLTVTIPTTYAEQLLHDGSEAYLAKRLDRAQEIFERLKLLEQRGSVKRSIIPEVAYNLARIYEDKREFSKALHEYNRLRTMVATQGRQDLKNALDKALLRIGKQTGHIVLSRRNQAGRCIEVDIYLPPGTHSIDLGLGKSEFVRVQAGVTTQINKCQK